MTKSKILIELELLLAKIDLLITSIDRPHKRYLTITNSAAYCDLSEESIRRLIARGKLTALRPVRGRVLIDRHELDSLVRGSVTAQRGGRGQARS